MLQCLNLSVFVSFPGYQVWALNRARGDLQGYGHEEYGPILGSNSSTVVTTEPVLSLGKKDFCDREWLESPHFPSNTRSRSLRA